MHKIIIFFSTFLFASSNAEHTYVLHTLKHSPQSHSRNFNEHTTHHDFSYDPTSNNHNWNKSSSYKHFSNYTTHDFQQYFAHSYTENQILNQRCLYMFDEFVKFAQTYNGYKCTIQQLHAELKKLCWLQKAWNMKNDTYCPGLQKRIHYLYNQLNSIKKEAPTHKEPIIRDHSLETFCTQLSEYTTLQPTYHTHRALLAHAVDKRLDTYNHMTSADYALQYASKSYNLDNNIKQLLNKYGHDTAYFTQCCGNQLHHVIHQESLDLLHHIDHLSPHSILYDHQEALIDFTVAMVDYNHEGLTDKATQIADFCWTLLDYSQAVAEGAALGIQSTVTDILNNPIEATLSIVASKPLLAYQLSKVLYNVADISLTAITNLDHAKDKWGKYTQPLNAIIDQIYNKEVSLRDAVKNGTALIVGVTAQSRLIGGLGKFCNTIKQKSITFAQNSSLLNPHEYLTTPEGLLFKATANANKLKQSGQSTASNLKNNIENKVAKNKSIKRLIKQESLPTKGKL